MIGSITGAARHGRGSMAGGMRVAIGLKLKCKSEVFQKYGRRLTMSGDKLIAAILKVALGIDYDDVKKNG